MDPTTLLQSSESDDGDLVRLIRIIDKGSRPQYAQVAVQGVPATGVVDSGADITNIGGELFKTVATTCKLKKHYFKPADKVPRTYNQQTFKLDGKMDLELAFSGIVMRTTVYVKMNAYDQLLLLREFASN